MLNKSKWIKKVVNTLNDVVKGLTGSKVVNKVIGKS